MFWNILRLLPDIFLRPSYNLLTHFMFTLSSAFDFSAALQVPSTGFHPLSFWHPSHLLVAWLLSLHQVGWNGRYKYFALFFPAALFRAFNSLVCFPYSVWFLPSAHRFNPTISGMGLRTLTPCFKCRSLTDGKEIPSNLFTFYSDLLYEDVYAIPLFVSNPLLVLLWYTSLNNYIYVCRTSWYCTR